MRSGRGGVCAEPYERTGVQQVLHTVEPFTTNCLEAFLLETFQEGRKLAFCFDASQVEGAARLEAVTVESFLIGSPLPADSSLLRRRWEYYKQTRSIVASFSLRCKRNESPPSGSTKLEKA